MGRRDFLRELHPTRDNATHSRATGENIQKTPPNPSFTYSPSPGTPRDPDCKADKADSGLGRRNEDRETDLLPEPRQVQQAENLPNPPLPTALHPGTPRGPDCIADKANSGRGRRNKGREADPLPGSKGRYSRRKNTLDGEAGGNSKRRGGITPTPRPCYILPYKLRASIRERMMYE